MMLGRKFLRRREIHWDCQCVYMHSSYRVHSALLSKTWQESTAVTAEWRDERRDDQAERCVIIFLKKNKSKSYWIQKELCRSLTMSVSTIEHVPVCSVQIHSCCEETLITVSLRRLVQHTQTHTKQRRRSVTTQICSSVTERQRRQFNLLRPDVFIQSQPCIRCWLGAKHCCPEKSWTQQNKKRI